jgi:uncharacterized protein
LSALATGCRNSNIEVWHLALTRGGDARIGMWMQRSAAWLACLAIVLAAWQAPAALARDEGRLNLGGSGLAPNAAKAQTSQQRSAAPPAGEFGAALAAAARRQTSHFVFYNPAYTKIAYPMGDVPRYFGVCTDVVVRAYRVFGIDLQVLVQTSGAGSGDPNIDHRRVEVLRRFFGRAGTSLPITANPADYKPGDLVTYYMPNGWLSKTHIAIVAAEKTALGVPLVIHNRGWGVEAEDWLFAEKITGHFRYAGPR